MERYRVLVVDDHPLFRDAIVRLLRSWAEIEVIGEAGSGRAALERIRLDAPDVAVVDLRMPDSTACSCAPRSAARDWRRGS